MSAQVDYGPAPLQQPTTSGRLLAFILVVLLIGGGVAAYIVYERNRPEPVPIMTETDDDGQNRVRISSGSLLMDAMKVMGARELTPERAERIERDQQRLAERRARLTAALRGQGYVEQAEAAATELATLESAFGGDTPWPDADAMTEAELAAAVRRAPAAYAELAPRLEALAEKLSGTLVGDSVYADLELLDGALETARSGLLAELKAEAKRKVQSGDYAAAMAVFSTERYPVAMIPRLDYFDADAQAQFEATFHQLLKEELVYDIAVHHFTPTVAPMQEAWNGGEIVAAVTLDDTLRPLVAGLPAASVAQQMDRARQHFLAPFSQRFLELVRATHQHRPATADDVDASLAAIEATLAPVQSWGLPEFTARARTIVEGYRSDFAERFASE